MSGASRTAWPTRPSPSARSSPDRASRLLDDMKRPASAGRLFAGSPSAQTLAIRLADPLAIALSSPHCALRHEGHDSDIDARDRHRGWIRHSMLVTLIATALVLAAAFSSLIAFRFGAPLLLLFLAIGLASGTDGLGIEFDNAHARLFRRLAGAGRHPVRFRLRHAARRASAGSAAGAVAGDGRRAADHRRSSAPPPTT